MAPTDQRPAVHLTPAASAFTTLALVQAAPPAEAGGAAAVLGRVGPPE